MVANAYLEGVDTEVYPHITRDAEGVRRLFKQFSFPGGIPSHVATRRVTVPPRRASRETATGPG
jgi:phosphoketolase